MKITREKHQRYINRLTPALMILIAFQAYLYSVYAPGPHVQEVTYFLLGGLLFLVGSFCVYDHFHQITLHGNHLEIKFSLLDLNEEILYGQIQEVKIREHRFAFADVDLVLRDGRIQRLRHVDNAHQVKDLVLKNNRLE